MTVTAQGSRRSRKTTICGIIGAVGVLLVAGAALFDGDPSTQADMAGAMQAVGALLAALGVGGAGVVARDDDVSSTGHPARKGMRP
jgi:hypothetical protein